MRPWRFPVLISFLLFRTALVLAGDSTEQRVLETWARWKGQPVTEANFRSVCDLVQDAGRSNLNLSYKILSEYLPIVRKAGNRGYAHVLLMSWARAKESLGFFEEAEGLYRQARENAAGDARLYGEALVGTVLMYGEWDKLDSLDKYASLGKAVQDKENLSFIYTFGSIAHTTDTAAMGRSLREAMRLAADVPNKNALFAARYNYATMYLQNNPQERVLILTGLLELAKDSSLNHKPRLYERTNFYFRNPVPSIYSQLMQVELLLADYDAAGKFGQMLYDVVVKPNPGAPQAPYFTAELAIVKAYQGDYGGAKEYLVRSRESFRAPEEKIPYSSYFIAAGLVAEQEGQPVKALAYFSQAYKMGREEGLHLMPSQLYYAHGLILNGRLEDAARVLSELEPALKVRRYSAYGQYYYQYYSELQKARKDYRAYAESMENYYNVRDSLISFHHYQAIQEIEARVRLRDKEQQIVLLNVENEGKERDLRRERIAFLIFAVLGLVIAVLLAGYIRNRVRQMQKQHRIDVMQGAIDAEENERRQIADQLHDEVGSMLSLATLNVTSTLEKGGDEGAMQRLGKTQEILSSVAGTIRQLSHQLTPVVIEKRGLRGAVEEMAETVNLSGKLRVQAVVVGFEDGSIYDAVFLKDCYRILQELLQNVIKHAQATEAMVQLVEHPGLVSIQVEDNGNGIREGDKEGKGLAAIRSKVAYWKGRIEIGRGDGTLVVIELPVKTK
ncbi:MAG: hypothetical protein JST68_26130 [Bacteroidetes bacterium]|nr:hypothetical protein [Bacteroidota bacterium]